MQAFALFAACSITAVLGFILGLLQRRPAGQRTALPLAYRPVSSVATEGEGV